MKRNFLKIGIIAVLLAVVGSGSSLPIYAATGLNVQYHSITEIKNREKAIIPLINKDNIMSSDKPVFKAPYNPGTVSKETQTDAITILNFIRYVAGIPDDVQIKDEYQKKAQAGAFINAVNGGRSHHPTKSPGMDESLYQLCASGAGSSNLGWGYRNIYKSFMGWMQDEDPSNVDCVGHRRWCLNPEMKYTGIGIAGSYSSLYAFDHTFAEKNNSYVVAWPAQNTPLELVGEDLPWSVSFGKNLDVTSIHVTLKNKKSGQSWNFSSAKKDGDFYVNNVGYGQVGCVIVRPKNIKKYNNGDAFSVEINGQTENGEKIAASYDVNFFSGHQHMGGYATCTSLAECSICGEEYGTYAAHEWEQWYTEKKQQQRAKVYKNESAKTVGNLKNEKYPR